MKKVDQMIKMIFSEHQNVEKEICVCLNDEETRILFVDQKHGDMSVSQRLKSNFVVAESTVFIFTSLQDFVLISEMLFFLCILYVYLHSIYILPTVYT